MAKLVIFGATGYTGGNILDEALRRGHEVVAVSRSADALTARERLSVEQGSMHDQAFVAKVTQGADVIVSAVRAREHEGKKLLDAVPALLDAAVAVGARFGVVGGAASLHTSEGGPRLLDTPGYPPEQWKPEALSHAEVLDALRAAEHDVDWFYVSPPALYGSYAAGERTGSFRVGGDVLLTDAEGKSTIGGEDFAIAFLDEIEKPAHHKRRFTVAY